MVCYLRNVQDLLSDGKTPYERRFGEPFKGPIIPFGSMIEFHLFLPKTCLEHTNLARQFCLAHFSDMHCTRVEFGRETIGSQSLRRWKIWTRQKSMLEDSLQSK